MSEYHSHFEALRRPTRIDRIVVLLAGPVLWVVAFAAVAWASGHTDLIWKGVAVAAASFAIGSVALLIMRAGRLREERRPEPRR
jgi:hypothetical protein